MSAVRACYGREEARWSHAAGGQCRCERHFRKFVVVGGVQAARSRAEDDDASMFTRLQA